MPTTPQEEEKKIYFRTRIPANLHKQFKLLSVELGITMEDIAAGLIEKWVNEQQKGKKK